MEHTRCTRGPTAYLGTSSCAGGGVAVVRSRINEDSSPGGRIFNNIYHFSVLIITSINIFKVEQYISY
jgi:hypothetical protein